MTLLYLYTLLHVINNKHNLFVDADIVFIENMI